MNLTESFVKYASDNQVPDFVYDIKSEKEIDDPKTAAAVYLAVYDKLAGSNEGKCSLDTLLKRAGLLGITPEISAMVAAISKPEPKTASAPEVEKYPVRNAEEWDTASKWLFKNASALSLEDRRGLAAKLTKTASEYKKTASDLHYAYSGEGEYDPAVLLENVCRRQDILKVSNYGSETERAKAADGLSKLAAYIAVNPKTAAANEAAIINTLQFIDGEYGLNKKYGSFIQSPDYCFHSINPKKAEYIKENGVVIADSIYDINEFENIRHEKFAEYFGDEAAADLFDGISVDKEKVAEFLTSLDEQGLQTAESLLAEQGIIKKGSISPSQKTSCDVSWINLPMENKILDNIAYRKN